MSLSLNAMNGNQAILDRPTPADTAAEPARAGASRGPWLQLGTIQQFTWTRQELPLSSLPPALEGLRILHLSDIHFKGGWYPAFDRLHARVQRDLPDLIFITGDFVEDKFDSRPALQLVERFVSGLRSRYGIFAVTGNHDGDLIGPRVARWGVNVLPIGAHPLTVRSAQIELITLAGVDRKDLTTQDVLDLRPRGPRLPPVAQRVPRLVLSHYPDALRRVQALNVAPDIHFAGHTHGGQVCLPGGIPILRHDTLPRRYCSGVHRLADTWLVVSRGMGYSSYPIRVFCPAEVVEVVLRMAG
ncbi:MAG TPA: metallophosphoesterase [Tepidisphaeraceae bacterium]|nr:metallophosphoesterase [Tepidisphaeraceae bacterium]